MTAITAVLFDYGLVLSGPQDPLAWQAMLSTLNVEEVEFAQAYWAHRHDYDRGTLSGVSYWRAVAADLDRPLADVQLRTLIGEDVRLWTQPNAPMIEWAAQLQGAGIATGILSNIGDEMESGLRKEAKWLQSFAHHTFSHRLKIAKPELAIYEHAAEGLGVPVDQILFIDDREENIAGAEAAGMLAIQYINHGQFVEAMHARGLGHLLEI